jgi:hypothetical protein
VQTRVERHAKAAGLDHPAERAAGFVQRADVEMHAEARGGTADFTVGDADLFDRAGGQRQRGPQAGIFEQAAAAGGDGVGAAIEIRMLHRRQGGAVDRRDAQAGGGKTARQRTADRAGANDADIIHQMLAPLRGAFAQKKGITLFSFMETHIFDLGTFLVVEVVAASATDAGI